MNEMVTVEVTTQVFGLGGGRKMAPKLVALAERTISARELIAEHVRAELVTVAQRRVSSLALHYLLADDVGAEPTSAGTANRPNAYQEIQRAWQGLTDRRYMLVVDGVSAEDLDTPLTLTERSQITCVRLLPLVGG